MIVFIDRSGGVQGQGCSTAHNDAGLTPAKVPHMQARYRIIDMPACDLDHLKQREVQGILVPEFLFENNEVKAELDREIKHTPFKIL